MKIGDNIKKLRQWRGMGQKEMSTATGIPQGTLSKIEAGNDFLWSKLIKISEALNCEVQDVVCFDASKVTFNLIGDRAKGMVINQNSEHLAELNRVLKEENKYLKKMLEKALNNKPQKARKQ